MNATLSRPSTLSQVRLCLTLGLVVACGCAEMPAPGELGESPVVDPAATAPVPPTSGLGVAPALKARGHVLEAALEFRAFAPQRREGREGGGDVLNDILTHLSRQYGSTYYDRDPITHGHETSHGIHSDIRNHHNDTGKRVNGFYMLRDRAVLVVEPNIRKSHAAPYIPAGLRGSRYDLYVTGSHAWDDTPLYLWDEWNAYVNGGEVGVDMVENGLWNRGWRDGVAGQLEFTVYAIALAMAVEERDPAYFAEHTQFLAFLAYNSRRAMEVYRVGAKMEAFSWDRQDAYYAKLTTGEAGRSIREFTDRIFGHSWTREVLLGEANPEPELPEVDPEPELPEVDPEPGPPEEVEPLQPGDADADGVPDDQDRCSNSPVGRPVWTHGEWLGCAGGQHRDPPRVEGPDADLDGIVDRKDLCQGTRAGAVVWRDGPWLGCAGGQIRDADRR